MDDNAWLIDLSQRVLGRIESRPPNQWSEPERVFVAIWLLEADVNNGGFDQYYLNSAGDHASAAPWALRTIGAQKAAAIVERANAPFGADGPPADRQARSAAIEQLPEGTAELWEDADQAFYSYPDDLTTLLAEYVRANEAQIRGTANQARPRGFGRLFGASRSRGSNRR